MDVPFFFFRPVFPLLALLALASGCAHSSAHEGQRKIVALDIEGTDKIKASDIKEKIVTSRPPWWQRLNPFTKATYFDPNTWQADLKRIVRYYQAQGFYEARVESAQQQNKGEDAIALEVRVHEGSPTTVTQLNVTGLEELSEPHRAQALEDLPIAPGAVFREEQWGTTKEMVQQRLHELGYAEAEVGGEVQVDLATQSATVNLRVQAGPRYRFGNIFVATDADPQVNPRRIIEQAQGSVKKGEWFSESALSEAQARVFRMGVFGAVKVNRGAPDREARTVPVVVDVREAPFRTVRAGGGIGLDAARQEIRVLGEWTHRNFFGGLRKLTLTSRVGYAFIPNIAAAFDRTNESASSGPVFQFSAQFEQPRFIQRDLRLQTSLTAERGLEQAYNFIGGRLRGGVVWQPRHDFSFSPTYNLELYNLNGQRGSVDQTTAPALVLGCPDAGAGEACNVSVSYLEQFFELNRRDDPLAPRRGFYASLSLQEGGGPLLGNYDFVRVLPDVRFYHTFGPKDRFTLAARLRMGTLVPLSDRGSAIVNRFFAGGGSSMRGFNARRLSPMSTVTLQTPEPGQAPVAPADTVVPVGGNSLVETSVELRAKLFGDLTLALFHDSGLAGAGPLSFGAHKESEYLESGRLFGDNHYQAVGFGLRYNTLVGPIRVDVARRLNIGKPLPILGTGVDTYGQPAVTTLKGLGDCFGIGVKQVTTVDNGQTTNAYETRSYAGAPEGLCTFFLSIGEAF